MPYDLPKAIEDHIRESSAVKLSLLQQVQEIAGIAEMLCTLVADGGTIYACGNGGSACDAMHLVEELVARYKRERPGIRAQHLCDPATMTCWSNDYSFATVFERQVLTHLTKRDVLVVFSTSGNSENILRAITAANQVGAKTVALLGKGGGKAKVLAQKSLLVQSDVTAHIQEAHAAVIHVICEHLELKLFS